MNLLIAWLFMWDFRKRPAGQKIREPVRKQIMRKKNRTGKRLRLTPLILGGYAAFLGFGLIVIGLTEMKEGIGIVRLLIGLGMAGLFLKSHMKSQASLFLKLFKEVTLCIRLCQHHKTDGLLPQNQQGFLIFVDICHLQRKIAQTGQFQMV